MALLREGLESVQREGRDDDDADADAEGGADVVGGGEDANGGIARTGGDVSNATTTARSIAVFGHSMGARAALLTALKCSSDIEMRLRPDLVVLVAPALAGLTLPSASRRRRGESSSVVLDDVPPSRRSYGGGGRIGSVVRRAWVTWRRIFVDRPLRYGLRRLVW